VCIQDRAICHARYSTVQARLVIPGDRVNHVSPGPASEASSGAFG